MFNKVIFRIVTLFLSLTSFLIPQTGNNISVKVVHPERKKQLVYNDNNLFNPIYEWKLFFLNNKFPCEVINDYDLDNFNFRDTDVLILPSKEVLSDEAAVNIKEYLNSGGGIFVIAQLGLYDESGKV